MLTNKRVIIIQKQKNRNMVNWINSWKSSNKKNKIDFTFRFGWLTIWEIKWCASCKPEDCCKNKFRLMLLNFGFEIGL